MAKKAKPSTALESIRKLADELPQSATGLTTQAVKKFRTEVASLAGQLERLAIELDPIQQPGSVFNPANPRTVGLFVSIALLAQDRHPLASVRPFYGSGVYAIYYEGPFPAYRPLAKSENPIYVGKADPATPEAKSPREQEQRLYRRINEHFKTIKNHAANLDIAHFTCRSLVVQSGLQTAAEDYLIHLFRPIWNKQIGIAMGIGKHGDAPETRGNQRSPWDTLHQGRKWAHSDPKMRDQKSEAQIVANIATHFQKHTPYPNIQSVLKKFYEDLKQK